LKPNVKIFFPILAVIGKNQKAPMKGIETNNHHWVFAPAGDV